MRAVVTVVGKDKVGIIAKVSGMLAELNFNVEDITQTVMQDFFVMLMLITLQKDTDIAAVAEKLETFGQSLGVSIRIQHEAIFDAMHRI